MTKPQKVGMWEKEQIRLEELLTLEGTTIIRVRGPGEVVPERTMPPEQILEDNRSVEE